MTSQDSEMISEVASLLRFPRLSEEKTGKVGRLIQTVNALVRENAKDEAEECYSETFREFKKLDSISEEKWS